MWRACWNDILYLAMMVHQSHKAGFGNGQTHWRGKQWWLKNAVRAGVDSFQLFLIEIFLFKSNHTGKLIPLQNRRADCTEHEKKNKFFLFWHGGTITKPMASACGSLTRYRDSRTKSEKRASSWLESDVSGILIPSRFISIKFNKYFEVSFICRHFPWYYELWKKYDILPVFKMIRVYLGHGIWKL